MSVCIYIYTCMCVRVYVCWVRAVVMCVPVAGCRLTHWDMTGPVLLCVFHVSQTVDELSWITRQREIGRQHGVCGTIDY